jgi:hypothetical protein
MMQRKIAALVCGGILMAGCSANAAASPSATPSPAPTDTPAITGQPAGELTPSPEPTFLPASLKVTASSAAIKVGEEVTISGALRNMGIPVFTVHTGSGGEIRLAYNSPMTLQAPDQQFEVVSSSTGMNEFTLVLRALQPGEATIAVSVSGEVFLGSPSQPAFSWGYAGGEVTITVEP